MIGSSFEATTTAATELMPESRASIATANNEATTSDGPWLTRGNLVPIDEYE